MIEMYEYWECPTCNYSIWRSRLQNEKLNPIDKCPHCNFKENETENLKNKMTYEELE